MKQNHIIVYYMGYSIVFCFIILIVLRHFEINYIIPHLPGEGC